MVQISYHPIHGAQVRPSKQLCVAKQLNRQCLELEGQQNR